MGKTSKIKKLEGVINGLVRELEKLAPTPDRPISLTTSFNIDVSANIYRLNSPRRMGLERRLAAARRLMAALKNQIQMIDAPALAAA